MKYVIILLCVFVTYCAFSQQYPKKIVYESDTCMVFDLEQSKQLIVWVTERDECLEERGVLESEISLKDSIISNNVQQIAKYVEIDSLYQNVLIQKNELAKICELEKESLRSEIKQQKRRKWVAIIGGSITTGVVTYLWIRK